MYDFVDPGGGGFEKNLYIAGDLTEYILLTFFNPFNTFFNGKKIHLQSGMHDVVLRIRFRRMQR